jgi:hypothetical protein
MKKQLIITICICSLQIMSCKLVHEFTITANPSYTELNHGNYCGSMYSAATMDQQATLQSHSDFCNAPKEAAVTEADSKAPLPDSANVAVSGDFCSLGF